ncbi:hypothetical protein PC112_g10375 [Phytophthora cactorum]|nr:hypothetical protein PC112_g10375 [Phytophthora cactorum]
MAKDRFVQNLFPDLDLSVADKAELQALVTTFIEEHLPNYREYCANKTRQVDTNRWKLFKTKDNYEKRKVTFCPVCIKDALDVSALQVARDQTLAPKRLGGYRSNSEFSATSSSDE